jgi:hypothetical protein
LTESRLEEILSTGEAQVSPVSVDNVDIDVDIMEVVKERSVDTVDKSVNATSDRLLSRADFAKRLGVNPGSLTRNRAKPQDLRRGTRCGIEATQVLYGYI